MVAGLPENDFTRQGKEQENNTTMPPFSHPHCKDLGGVFFSLQPPRTIVHLVFISVPTEVLMSLPKIGRIPASCPYVSRADFSSAATNLESLIPRKWVEGLYFWGRDLPVTYFPLLPPSKSAATAVDGGGKQIRFSHYLISSFPRSLIPVCRGAHTVHVW